MKLSANIFLIYSIISVTTSAKSEVNNQLYIKSLIAKGNACKTESVSAVLSPSGNSLNIMFNKFHHELMHGISSKSCEIKLAISSKDGWSFSFSNAVFKGSANLQSDDFSKMYSNFAFKSGRFTETPFQVQLHSPFKGQFTENSEHLNVEDIWSPCVGSRDLTININSMLETLEPGNLRKLELNALDYEIKWKKC